jgi:hypothetical protein
LASRKQPKESRPVKRFGNSVTIHKDKLLLAVRHVLAGRLIVESQFMMVAKLESAGCSTQAAKQTFRVFVNILKSLEHYERRIRKEALQSQELLEGIIHLETCFNILESRAPKRAPQLCRGAVALREGFAKSKAPA